MKFWMVIGEKGNVASTQLPSYEDALASAKSITNATGLSHFVVEAINFITPQAPKTMTL